MPVSLRDLAATMVDISGFKSGSPFPGASLIGAGAGSRAGEAPLGTDASPAFSELANEIPPYAPSGKFDAVRWPLAALMDGDWCYIQRGGAMRELLFNVREDAGESSNRANDPTALPTLKRMRQALEHLTAGRLTPDRFNP